MARSNPILGALLVLAACSARPRAPEADLPASLALSGGGPVRVLVQVALAAPLTADQLAEAFACSLEQSTTLDFQVEPIANEQPPSPARSTTLGARVDLILEPLPGSPTRWRLRADALRLADQASTRLVASLRSTGPADLLAGVDAKSRALRRTLGEPVAAILAYNQPLARALTANPEALAALGRARSAIRAGKVVEAGEALDAAIRKDPACTRARVFLASLLLDAGASEAANRLLEVATLGLASVNAVDQHRHGRLRLRTQGRHEELRLAGEAFLDSHPGSPEGAFSLGIALNHLQRFRHAEPIWTALVSRDRFSVSARFQLGLALYGLGRYHEAAQTWDELDRLGAQALQAAFFPALARLAMGPSDAARTHLQAFLTRARGQAALRARLRLLLCAQAILAHQPERADQEALAVLRECRADPGPTLHAWGPAARFLVFRRKSAEVERFLAQLPLTAEYTPEEMRLAALWLQGLIHGDRPRESTAAQASARLRENRWIQEACQIDALIAAATGNLAVRVFNLQEAFQTAPTPWNRYQLAAGLLEAGRHAEAIELLEALDAAGLGLDPGRIDLHPAANPLAAVALVEGRRLLAEARRP